VLGRAHGVSGEIIFRPYHAQSPGIEGLPLPATVTLGQSGERSVFVICAFRKTAQGFLVRFEGVSSREAAAQLTGRELLVRREALPPLKANEFYVEDLVGCVVQDLKGDTLGVVSGVFWNGAHDVMSLDGGERCIPVVSNFIVGVDCGSRIVTVNFHD
jgi:16S rRNA processing protein RimM